MTPGPALSSGWTIFSNVCARNSLIFSLKRETQISQTGIVIIASRQKSSKFCVRLYSFYCIDSDLFIQFSNRSYLNCLLFRGWVHSYFMIQSFLLVLIHFSLISGQVTQTLIYSLEYMQAYHWNWKYCCHNKSSCNHDTCPGLCMSCPDVSSAVDELPRHAQTCSKVYFTLLIDN